MMWEYVRFEDDTQVPRSTSSMVVPNSSQSSLSFITSSFRTQACS